METQSPNKDNKTERLQVYLTPGEHDMIKRASNKCRERQSAFAAKPTLERAKEVLEEDDE